MRSENYLVYLRSTSFICLYTKCTLHCNLRLIRTEIISVMITELDLRSPLTGRYVGSSRMHSASRDHPPPRRILIQTVCPWMSSQTTIWYSSIGIVLLPRMSSHTVVDCAIPTMCVCTHDWRQVVIPDHCADLCCFVGFGDGGSDSCHSLVWRHGAHRLRVLAASLSCVEVPIYAFAPSWKV